jgi:hypothetical protein
MSLSVSGALEGEKILGGRTVCGVLYSLFNMFAGSKNRNRKLMAN